MKIRKANKNDNHHKLLELIYTTDEYIYPVLMPNGFEEYKHLLLENGMYNYKNIEIATVNNEVAGLIVSFRNDVALPTIANPFLYNHFKELKSTIDSQSEYINNVSVFNEFRGMGIGSSLIRYIEENTKMQKVVLDCLEENTNAIRLYEKLGFAITEISAAFCLDSSKKVNAVRMEKML